MDPNVTRPIPKPGSVLYQCACGEQLVLGKTEGGQCTKCDQVVSPKMLNHNMGVTVSLDNGSFLLDQTATNRLNPNPNTGTARLGDSAPEVLNGAMYGHFRIISPLGRGGMGQVYLALDTSLQRYVAVKVLRSGISSGSDSVSKSSDEEVDMLLKEAVSQARVTHPNIVTIYYVGKQGDNPFLAMEHVNGEPLSERVKSGDLHYKEIASIALDITNALKFSYDLDTIHGDIKPSNVLIAKNGTAKLSDFGMARSASNNTDDSLGGTPNYIAPELLAGEKPSVQSDIYALGVTFFEMMFGELPVTLTGRRIEEWVEMHKASKLSFPVPWPPRLPEQWKSILEKMLAKDPVERYQSYDELLAAITPLQPGSNIEARFFPRLIAAGIDWASVLSMAVVLQVGMGISTWQNLRDHHPVIAGLLLVCNFLPIIAYTTLIFYWRQSIGRSLMHIRVANQFGMKPTSNEMVLRCAVRMQFPWVVICLGLFRTNSSAWFTVILSSLIVVSLVFLLLDICFMLIYSKSRSIHDLVTKTHVVLDTNS